MDLPSTVYSRPNVEDEANSMHSTSPYAYVVFQTIEAGDKCGTIGGKYTSITWSFKPGELSTVEGRLGKTKSFNFADLPCPPASVAAADWYNYRGPEEPYKPIIAAVPQLFQLDPLFKNCTVDIFEGYDPPRALTPAAVLAATTDPVTHTTKELSPQIGSQITSGPVVTPSRDPFTSVFDPVSVSTPAQDLPQDPLEQSTPTQTSPSSPAGTPVQDPPSQVVVPQSPPAFQTPSIHSPDPSPLRTLTPVPQPPAATPPAVIVGSQIVSQGALPIIIGTNTIAFSGGSIMVGITAAATSNALKPSGVTRNASPVVIGTFSFFPAPGPAASPPLVFVGGQTVCLDPGASFVVVGSQTITAASPTVIVAGTPVFLGPGASSIVVGPSTVMLTASTTAAPSLFAIGFNTLTAHPSRGFEIGGQTLMAGGPAVTVSGTPVSLGPSSLVIGTQTYTLAEAPLIFTAGGEVFTAAATGFAVGGTTVLPGQVVTIGGTPVSLDPTGSYLVIGTSTVALAETTQAGLAGLIMSGMGPIGGGNTPALTTLANGTTIIPFLGEGGRNPVPCVLTLASTSIYALMLLSFLSS